jgi:hypothetical protein
MDNLLLLMVLSAGVFAPLSGWFAAQRSRQPVTWFVLGALIGPLALAVLAIAPPGRCPSCGAPVDGWPTTCEQCGRRLDGSEGSPGRLPTHATAGEPDPAAAAGLQARQSRSERTTARPGRAGGRDRSATAGAMAETSAGEVLATGIYLSGNAGLEIGACYALSRVSAPDGDRLRVFGPVDSGQIIIRHEGPLADFDVTGVDDRLIISSRDGRSPLRCVFRALGGMRGDDLERALNRTSVSRP